MKEKLRSVVRSIQRNDLLWRYGSNLSSSVGYALSKPSRLNAAETEVVSSLREDGVAVTSIDKLFAGGLEFEALNSETQRLLESRRSEIDDLKKKAADASTIGEKTFNLEILGSELTFEDNSPFANFALHPSLLRIANAYLRMYGKLRYYNVWQTFASNGAPRESQLWHFDREDNYILKLFLYFSDVDEGAGPFTYARGTHRSGRFKSIKPKWIDEGGVRRTTDEQMKAVFPEENWLKGTGKRGTLIFADTRGYHKGGEARTKDRLMYTCMYTSPASESKRLIKFADDFDPKSLDEKQIRALQI